MLKKLVRTTPLILLAIFVMAIPASAAPKTTNIKFDKHTGFGTTNSGGTTNSTATNTVDGKGKVTVQTAPDCTSCSEQGFVSWTMQTTLAAGGTMTVKADFHYHGKSPHGVNANTIKLLACQPSFGCLEDAINADHGSHLQVTGPFDAGDVLIQVIMFSQLDSPGQMASARVRLKKITMTG